MRRPLILVLFIMVVAGCADETLGLPAGAVPVSDAGRAPSVDAALGPDAAIPSDVGPAVDAGIAPDAGVEPDAGRVALGRFTYRRVCSADGEPEVQVFVTAPEGGRNSRICEGDVEVQPRLEVAMPPAFGPERRSLEELSAVRWCGAPGCEAASEGWIESEVGGAGELRRVRGRFVVAGDAFELDSGWFDICRPGWRPACW